MKKLKPKDIPLIRSKILKKQKNKCAICGRKNQAWCLDHDHETGRIRGVLCRGCNSVEGKFRKAFVRYGLKKAKLNKVLWLQGLEGYYNLPQKNYIHPKHKSKQKAVIKEDVKATLKFVRNLQKR